MLLALVSCPRQAVLNAEAQVDKGENARMSSFVGAIAVADLVKSTLGPKGMDKILSSVSASDGQITITNDGATILKSIYVDNAAAKVQGAGRGRPPFHMHSLVLAWAHCPLPCHVSASWPTGLLGWLGSSFWLGAGGHCQSAGR